MQVEGYESCTGVESQRQILLPLDLDLKSEFPKPPSSPTSPGFFYRYLTTLLLACIHSKEKSMISIPNNNSNVA